MSICDKDSWEIYSSGAVNRTRMLQSGLVVLESVELCADTALFLNNVL